MNIISFEGIEGVGKSTQINLLKEFLVKNNFTVEVLREPGSTSAGESIRNILLNKDSDISNKTELLLMFAARSELINKKIQTSSCDYLLLDRFFDASIAYQGYGRNLPIAFIEDLIKFTDCPIPKLSILIDISVEEGFARKINDTKDRIESSSMDFFNNVRNGYLEIAKKNKNRFLVIDGSLSIAEIHDSIIKKLTT
jgi:dTMP kinase|tara:strand:- start:878 stop:1468 length:591 start_codon:yes stop_codon:yes gene_type:complete